MNQSDLAADAYPAGWISRQLGTMVRLTGGGTPLRSNPHFWGGSIPWLSSGDIKSDRLSKSSETITERGLEDSSAAMCSAGSIVLVVRSGILKHSLPVAILDRPAAINQDLRCLDSGNHELNEWIAMALRASATQILERNREGTTVQSVKTDTLRDWPIPVPPLEEQRRIMTKVEALLARARAVQERLGRVPQLLRRFRRAVLRAACSGNLTAKWRESSGLKAEWTETEIGRICECLDNKRRPINRNERSKRVGDIPYYGANGQVGWIDEWLFDEELVLVVEDESFVGRTKPFSYVIQGKSWVNNHAHILRPLNGMPAKYLDIHLAFYDFVPLTSGTTGRRKLTKAALLSAPLTIAPLAEQHEIVRRVAALFKLAEALESRVIAATARAERLTQAILVKAFRGELVPSEAELALSESRSYESAEQLLERVGAALTCSTGFRERKAKQIAAAVRLERGRAVLDLLLLLEAWGKGVSIQVLEPALFLMKNDAARRTLSAGQATSADRRTLASSGNLISGLDLFYRGLTQNGAIRRVGQSGYALAKPELLKQASRADRDKAQEVIQLIAKRSSIERVATEIQQVSNERYEAPLAV